MKFRLTSEFGALEEVREGAHTGIDLAMAAGTKLRSIVEGKILQVFDGSSNIGKGVKVIGTDGKEYIYGHMNKVNVKVGDDVKLGSVLGESGNTGNSTGNHLHFAVKEDGQFIDPTEYRSDLDKITGDINADDLNWWDFEGKLNLMIDNKIDAMKEGLAENVMDFLHYAGEVLVDMSYATALIGGGILIVLRVAGMRRATKYFSVLQVCNIFIKALLGGV